MILAAALKSLSNKQIFLLISATLLTGSFTAYFATHLDTFMPLTIGAERDFNAIPFDMLDATEYCKEQTQNQFGATLLHSYIDEHSTRWAPKEGLFKVFMSARVGTEEDNGELKVQCYIDPKKHKITHYRTIDDRDASLLSKALQFFK